MLTKESSNEVDISDIAVDQVVSIGVGQVREIIWGSGIGKRVEVYDLDGWLLLEQMANEITADESRSAGNQNIPQLAPPAQAIVIESDLGLRMDMRCRGSPKWF